jgi:hypothetical protein
MLLSFDKNWPDCYRYIFENIEYFLPVTSIEFTAVPTSNSSTFQQIDNLSSQIIAAVQRSPYFRNTLQTFGPVSKFYQRNNETAYLYCRYVALFDLFPNINQVPEFYYPFAQDMAATKMVKDCMPKHLLSLSQKTKIKTVILADVVSEAFYPLTKPGKGISTWPSLESISLTAYSPIDHSARAVEEILKVPRDIRLQMFVQQSLYRLEPLISAKHVKHLTIFSNLRKLDLIHNLSRGLDARTTAIESFRFHYNSDVFTDAEESDALFYGAIDRHMNKFRATTALKLSFSPFMGTESVCPSLASMTSKQELNSLYIYFAEGGVYNGNTINLSPLTELMACLLSGTSQRPENQPLIMTISGFTPEGVKKAFEDALCNIDFHDASLLSMQVSHTIVDIKAMIEKCAKKRQASFTNRFASWMRFIY